MTGREIAQMAFDLQKPPRVPVTLIGGGAWAVQYAGKTFGQIKNNPEQIADAFIRFFNLFQNDLIWTGSNFLNYPVHFLGCPIKDDSPDSPALGGTVIQSLDEIDRLKIEADVKTAKEILGGKVCVAGNVSHTGAFLSGNPGQVKEEAQACLAAWGDDGGYILTVGCDFSKNVPLENMKALMSFRK
jgi:hypothetical protein